jgi:hypothetical protein
MSYAPLYLVSPRQHDSRHAARSRELQAQARAADATRDHALDWVHRAWRFVAARPPA